MPEKELKRRYTPVFRHLKLGSKEYWIMDPHLAQTRAARHLQKALDLFDEEAGPLARAEGCEELLLACDFGCAEAPFLLALQILTHPCDEVLPHHDFLTFLRLAAERGNARAAYRLAASYAQMGHFPAIEALAAAHFACLPQRDKVRLAEYYFSKAIAADHDEAIDELIVAYAYGRGLIEKNLNKFQRLCETLAKKGKQSVMMGYGAWLCGLTVSGEDPLPGAVLLPKDLSRGMDYLMQASKGERLHLAQHALNLLLIAQTKGRLGPASLQQLQNRLLKEAAQGHQLLALYFSWYGTPAELRTEMPSFIAEQPLPQLQHFVQQDEEVAIKWIDSALFGSDASLAEMAKLLLGALFSKPISPKPQTVLSLVRS